MYHGLNCTLDYDALFGFLNHLDTEELKALHTDDSRLEGIVKDHKQYGDLEKEKEMLLVSNQSLAEFNLSLQPKLEQCKLELLERTQTCEDLLKSVEMKSSALAEKSGRSVLDAKLSSLQHATTELEEQSERYANSFLEGDCDLDEFLENFLAPRKQMHLEKVKADKMAEMLKQHYLTGI